MLDETIKQIVLKFKVDDQANFGEINKQFSKLNESFGKAIPTREANEFLRISEKIGGEFQKVAQNMTNMRMTQLKGDLKDVTQQLTDLQGKLRDTNQQLKAAALSGDAATYNTAYAQQGELMGQIATLGGQQQALMGATGGGGAGRFQRVMRGTVAAGQAIGAVGGIYGAEKSLQGFEQQQIIENRLARIESYSADLRRNQENLYGGNALRAFYDARYANIANQAAIGYMTGQRRELYGQTIGAEAGVVGAAGQGAAQGALTGFMGGGPKGAAIGAVTGGVGAAGQAVVTAQRYQFLLEQQDANMRAEIIDKRQEYMDRLARSDTNRFFYEQMFSQAPGRARLESMTGMGEGQLSSRYAAALRTGAANRQDIDAALMSTRGRMSTRAALAGIDVSTAMLDQGIGEGSLQERMGFVTGAQRQGAQVTDAAARNIGRSFEPGLQFAYQQQLSAGLEQTAMPVETTTMAGRYAGAFKAALGSGVSEQMAIEGFRSAVSSQDSIQRSGTIENQILRNSIRGPILSSGLSGGLAVSAENMISQMSFEELEAFSNGKDPRYANLRKALGMNPRALKQVLDRARRAKLDTLEFQGLDKGTKQRIMSGRTRPEDLIKMKLLESGGNFQGGIGGLAAGGSLIEQRITGKVSGVGGVAAPAETQSRILNRALNEPQAAGEEATQQLLTSVSPVTGMKPGDEALSTVRAGLSDMKTRTNMANAAIKGELGGLQSDAAKIKATGMDDVVGDVKAALGKLVSAISTSADQIQRSFGSAGKTISGGR